ncbi:hypothetical protein [Emticicia soli]|uniref:DUF4105 domain-containing protein n=1 Tax=Emticicia soli TaxID=2027878 RepID=A0ABW5J3L0_9BACT
MAYEGEPLNYCPANLDLSKVEMIVVSGSTKYGHSLLYIPKNGLYFQIAGIHAYPTMMNELGYRRYLKENGKWELGRIIYALPQPEGAYYELMMSTSKKWVWGGVFNNCTTFVEEVIRAGGSSSRINNFPTNNLQ